jgi:hypothetical protein
MEVVAASNWGRSSSIAAVGLAVVLSHAEAYAGDCTIETPACHLENGKRLLTSDPKRAAEELLASYKLDERTDTLTLYAQALENDKQHGLALETWQRIIVFRESELDAAKAAAKTARNGKRAAARAAAATAQAQMDQAGEAIIKLWPKIGRVRIQIPAGRQVTVTRASGVEVDATKDVLVNAGREELVFTGKDGAVARLTVEVAAGASATIEAPEPKLAKATAKPGAKPGAKPAPQPQKVQQQESPKLAETKAPAEGPAGEEPEAPGAKPTAEPAGVSYTEEPRSRTMQRVGIGLGAGAVLAAGAAVTLGVLASRDYDRSRDAGCSDGQCPFGPAADLAERSNDRARLAQISAIGGGVMLATGVALFIVGRGKTRRAATDITLNVNASSSSPSAAIGWRF